MHGSTKTIDGQVTSVLLNSLIPYATYNITVSAATIVGFGPHSNDLLVKTSQAGNSVIFSSIAKYSYTFLLTCISKY